MDNTINISRQFAIPFVGKDGVFYIISGGCVYEVVGVEEYGSWIVNSKKVKYNE